jgi:hypothetical protein
LPVLNCCFGPERTWILPSTDSICVPKPVPAQPEKAMREIATSIRPGSAADQDYAGHYREHGCAVVRGLFSSARWWTSRRVQGSNANHSPHDQAFEAPGFDVFRDEVEKAAHGRQQAAARWKYRVEERRARGPAR